jgi:hypothetical protein
LDRAAERVREEYELAAVFLARLPEPGHPAWLDLTDASFSGELYGKGYIFCIFCRREGGG